MAHLIIRLRRRVYLAGLRMRVRHVAAALALEEDALDEQTLLVRHLRGQLDGLQGELRAATTPPPAAPRVVRPAAWTGPRP